MLVNPANNVINSLKCLIFRYSFKLVLIHKSIYSGDTCYYDGRHFLKVSLARFET